MLRNEVEIVLATLSQREQAVIRLRFGLDDGRQRTLDEVGREFGLSRERIRQIEKVTLLKLRAPGPGQAAGGLRQLSRRSAQLRLRAGAETVPRSEERASDDVRPRRRHEARASEAPYSGNSCLQGGG